MLTFFKVSILLKRISRIQNSFWEMRNFVQIYLYAMHLKVAFCWWRKMFLQDCCELDNFLPLLNPKWVSLWTHLECQEFLKMFINFSELDNFLPRPVATWVALIKVILLNLSPRGHSPQQAGSSRRKVYVIEFWTIMILVTIIEQIYVSVARIS